ncbi:MAG: NADH-quinone oxidoreductase subunit J [Planctomycetota bacterium]|nr:NADH-quinone oxidoreductase subunit J [Planctomycetota bacterium]
MDLFVNPVILYALLALGGLGVALALPRPGVSPQVIGMLLGAVALGGAFLLLGLSAGTHRPGFYFYVFAAIALGAGLRVITHPKPVYSALYFIVTILASSALYLMLGAEFMAFALIIIYAGAILITYLFVIMLAEQAPSDEEVGALTEYDKFSREPAAAAAVGFILLALLIGMTATGTRELVPAEPRSRGVALLERMPRKVNDALQRQGVLEPRGGFAAPALPDVPARLDTAARTIRLAVASPERLAASLDDPRVASLFPDDQARDAARSAAPGQEFTLALPEELRAENIDGVGFTLVGEHPMALELAGVILLMAMVGAVVLARKQIEIGEQEKAAAALGAAASMNGHPPASPGPTGGMHR